MLIFFCVGGLGPSLTVLSVLQWFWQKCWNRPSLSPKGSAKGHLDKCQRNKEGKRHGFLIYEIFEAALNPGITSQLARRNAYVRWVEKNTVFCAVNQHHGGHSSGHPDLDRSENFTLMCLSLAPQRQTSLKLVSCLSFQLSGHKWHVPFPCQLTEHSLKLNKVLTGWENLQKIDDHDTRGTHDTSSAKIQPTLLRFDQPNWR